MQQLEIQKQMQQLALQNQIFRCKSGSHAYGTNTPASDIDERGVFIAPPKFSLGCLFNVEQVQISGEDTEIYELAKFVRLATDCNPNIIELLYTDNENIISIDQAWQRMVEHRHLFLSKKAKHTFSGYAMAQMKRIKGHNKWINEEARGVEKLRKLWQEEKITEKWLKSRFTEEIVKKVIS